MRPRNSRERLVAELSAKLPAITEKQRQWAIATCFDKVGNYEKGMVWCSQCGSIFDKTSSELGIALVGDETICPHCGTRLTLKNSRKHKISESWYFTILTTCKGFQVCRHFIIEKKMCRVIGCNEPNYTIHEAVQNWIAPDGSETIMARPCKCIPHIYDAWDFYKPMKHYEPSFEADNQERVVWYTDSPWGDVEHMKKFDPNKCSVLGCKLFNNMKLSDEVLEALDENDYTAMPLPSNGCVNFVEAEEDKPTDKVFRFR